MGKIYLTDVVLGLLAIWLLANILHYVFYRDAGGGFFSLSNSWIKKEKEKKR